MARRELAMRKFRKLCSADLGTIRRAVRNLEYLYPGSPGWEMEGRFVLTPDTRFFFGEDGCEASVREGGSRAAALKQRTQLAREVDLLTTNPRYRRETR